MYYLTLEVDRVLKEAGNTSPLTEDQAQLVRWNECLTVINELQIFSGRTERCILLRTYERITFTMDFC